LRILPIGLGLTGLVTGALVVGFGRGALLSGLVMGGLATGIEMVAARWLRRGLAASTPEAMQGFAAGLLFRLLGVGVFAGLVVWNRVVFAPLPTALGFLGVSIPLLFLETRFIR